MYNPLPHLTILPPPTIQYLLNWSNMFVPRKLLGKNALLFAGAHSGEYPTL